MRHDSGHASIVERIVALLGAFDEPAALGLSELARRSGLPKATTYRLARQLAESGLLERQGDRYQLGVRMFELSQLVPRSRTLRDAALPFLEDLYVASRETVHLAVPDGRHVMYIERIAGHDPRKVPSRVAGRFPMHGTATGKAMLAHVTPSELDQYLEVPLERVTAFTVTVPQVMRAELEKVRELGFAVEREETAIGYVSTAAPVLDRSGRPLAALSVTGPVTRLDPERFGQVVRTAARALGRVLGAA